MVEPRRAIRPGATQLTVIPCGPTSRLSVLSQPMSAGPERVREREVRSSARAPRATDRDDPSRRRSSPDAAGEPDERHGRTEEEAVRGVERLGSASRRRRAAGRRRSRRGRRARRSARPRSRRRARDRASSVTSPRDGDAAEPRRVPSSSSRGARRERRSRPPPRAPRRSRARARTRRRRRARCVRSVRDPRRQVVRTPTTSRTAAAELPRAPSRSSSARSSSTISSMPPAPSLHRDAHVEAVDAVLALEVGRAGEHALLVEHDRVDHLRGRRARRVPGRGAEQVDELAAALRRALDHRLDPVLGDELAQRDAADGGRARRRAPSGRRGRRAPSPCTSFTDEPVSQAMKVEKRAVSRMPGHARRRAPSASRETFFATWHIASSGFETTMRIASGHCATTCSVTEPTIFSFVVTRSSRLMPGERGRPAVITTTSRAGGLLVAVRAGDVRLVAEHGAHLVDVERLALRQALLDVDEDDVGVVARREHLRARRADVPGADDGDLAPRCSCGTSASSFSMIASATSLVPTAVGSSRVGFMS